MLKKKINIKGLKKKILKFEYEKNLLAPEFNCTEKNQKNKNSTKLTILDREQQAQKVPSNVVEELKSLNFRILILRSEPIKQKIDLNLTNIKGVEELGKFHLHSKCIKKSVLKKTVFNLINCDDFKKDQHENWLKCKYIYWLTPDPISLKEQFIHLNLLKNYLITDSRDEFLGCLLESRSEDNLINKVKNSYKKEVDSKEQEQNKFFYKYYYPSQIINLCNTLDKLSNSNKATGLELLGQLFYTLDSSVNSISNLLAFKKEKTEEKT
jgi:hypothetical protein